MISSGPHPKIYPLSHQHENTMNLIVITEPAKKPKEIAGPFEETRSSPVNNKTLNFLPTRTGAWVQKIPGPFLYPPKVYHGTWNLKMMVSKRNLLVQGAIFRWTMLNFGREPVMFPLPIRCEESIGHPAILPKRKRPRLHQSSLFMFGFRIP